MPEHDLEPPMDSPDEGKTHFYGDDCDPPHRTEPPTDSRCEHGWGDFRCQLPAGHDGPHQLAWDGDEDDE